jgi:hypothetical protein
MPSNPRYAIAAMLVAGIAGFAPGCAAIKATQQPSKRNMGVLDRGVPRTHVVAELGTPAMTDQRDGDAIDVFSFKQGYSKTNKAARAIVHAAADVATFGLWEVVGIPAETLADGTDVQVEVHYDAQQNVKGVVVIKGEKAVNPPKLFAHKRREEHKPPRAQDLAPATNPAIASDPATITD